eukprot:TRINITY_DN31580_c0_g2_i1.p1 TRINITY_DN31580_c0_g2~~TRINITY_DN31580_c0_g2_i1.p1  ORF type:complete len:320 (-),score=27.65 TRINITY_DN31580_c0_g2_i1:97-1056(-)
MALLLTHHDKFHVHAMLGLAALLHFAYRFGWLFVFWEDSFHPSFTTAACLAVHFLLHVTSFQFVLPKQRQYSQPMIWVEFRAHNAVFAYRHLIGVILGVWFPRWWWLDPPVWSIAAKVVLVVGTCAAADYVTARLGSIEKRTTNAMPYPGKTRRNIEQTAKWFYAKSQFAATSLAAFGPPSLTFGSILAIELASLLMTLVRKGIIASRTYHIMYAASLFVMFPAMVVMLHAGDGPTGPAAVATFRALCTCFVSCEMRLTHRLPKILTWSVSILAGTLAASAIVHALGGLWIILAWAGMLWSVVDTATQLRVCSVHECST